MEDLSGPSGLDDRRGGRLLLGAASASRQRGPGENYAAADRGLFRIGADSASSARQSAQHRPEGCPDHLPGPSPASSQGLPGDHTAKPAVSGPLLVPGTAWPHRLPLSGGRHGAPETRSGIDPARTGRDRPLWQATGRAEDQSGDFLDQARRKNQSGALCGAPEILADNHSSRPSQRHPAKAGQSNASQLTSGKEIGVWD